MGRVKKVRFKNPDSGVLNHPRFGQLHEGNMTPALLEQLVKEDKSLADVFEVKDEEFTIKPPKSTVNNDEDQPEQPARRSGSTSRRGNGKEQGQAGESAGAAEG